MIWPTIKELEARLSIDDAEFRAWVNSVPDKCWVRMDLSALRVGYELGRSVGAQDMLVSIAERRPS